ncbi:MAG: carbon-nitrogen hydrolase family protein [Thermoanaerobaculia bacterium]|nr:carbon-nitrogen hydrolase family protein [Thermoanaerobaculia bacterium]MBP9823557.1 carbon-nitrogen hydrolase family protein [Thermoanaerobaculia bacterium]
MRVTVAELPHEPWDLEAAWAELCRHTVGASSELVLLPELAFVEPVWESEYPDADRLQQVEELSDLWLKRLPELGVPAVVGARPVRHAGRPSIEAFLWTEGSEEPAPLRRKHFLPDEPGAWEARWFSRGDPLFPVFRARDLTFGVNICTELWALETYAGYAVQGAQAILSPRATATATIDKWLAVGRVAAIRSGAYSLSSNRVDPTGTCGGGGWILDPDGRLLALTLAEEPFATIDLDLASPTSARTTYPRTVFAESGSGTC